MHAVIRTYTGPAVIDVIVANMEEIQDMISSVEGFVSYTAIRSMGGTTTVTVCNDKAGCDESMEVAANFLADKVPSGTVPTVTEGHVELYFNEDDYAD